MKPYSEKLKDPRWQKKRLEVMQRDDFKCAKCGDDKSTLAVHHLYYVSGRKPWQYPMWSMQTLCEDCHKGSHYREEDYEPGINPEEEWEAVIGFFGMRCPKDFEREWDTAVQVAMLQSALGGGRLATCQFADWLESAARVWRKKIENFVT